MIAPLPDRVLTLLRESTASAPIPRPLDSAIPNVRDDTMRALIGAAKAQGFTTPFIVDALDRRIHRYLETVGHRGEGDRNATAYRVARWLLNDFGVSEAVAWAYVVDWNAGNAPPLSERELHATFRSAKRHGQRAPGCAHRSHGTAA